MFEKLFGKKLNNIKGKDSIQPSVNGVAHFDGNFNEAKINPGMDFQQEVVTLKEEREKVKQKMDKDSMGKNEKRGDGLKSIRKDKNKDWKEKEPFALDLSEESEDLNEKHLNAMAETYDDGADFEDDSDLGQAA